MAASSRSSAATAPRAGDTKDIRPPPPPAPPPPRAPRPSPRRSSAATAPRAGDTKDIRPPPPPAHRSPPSPSESTGSPCGTPCPAARSWALAAEAAPPHAASRQLRVAEAARQVIVDHPRRLHEGITNRRTRKSEPALAETPTHGVALLRARRDFLQIAPLILHGAAAYEAPDVPIERAELSLYRQERLGIRHRRVHL